jgi:hypothetical protein
MTRVSTHSQVCDACRNAFEAAQLATLVVKERAHLTIEPPAFFQSRVLAALRERQATESVPAFGRLWKAAGALVSSMAVTTAALAVLSFVVPTSVTTGADDPAYSAESIILDQGSDEPLTYEQVLSTIYAEEDEAR